jgi:molybdenum cofactor cytidylyltransferase
MTEQLTAIVLAAGLSRRMGKDNKLILPFGETTILEATLTNILTARVGETLVVVGHEANEIVSVLMSNPQSLISDAKFQAKYPRLQTSNVKGQTERGPLSINAQKDTFLSILTNNDYEKGMTTTIQTGVEAANDASVGYMICLSDMPFIAPAEYQFLKEQFLIIWAKDPQAIVQPTYEGKRGNPTIFSSVYKKDILNLTYTEGCKPIVQANVQHVYLVEMPTDSVLKDIDSKEEYARFTL